MRDEFIYGMEWIDFLRSFFEYLRNVPDSCKPLAFIGIFRMLFISNIPKSLRTFGS